MALIGQEVSAEREIEIPEPVRDAYRLYRPSPLYRAHRLERALDTPAHIYYKYEGGSPAGSHKPNTAIPQAFYNKEEGVTRLATETGAGQWGSALAFAGALFGLEVKVYMVRASYDQKPYRRILMETYGAEVVASPSLTTNYGRAVLAETPDSPGSLGMAISEAVEDAATRDDTKYALGSVLNHVLLHQTVIGQEAIEQMGMAGESPDVVIGCTGGGSNFAGLTFPFLGRNFRDGAKHRIIAVEPEAAPSLTRGVYAYDFGDTGKMAPIVKMHTLGSDFIPEPIHAGGLRYHGMSPLVSLLKEHGLIEAQSVHQRASLRGGRPVRPGRGDPAGARSRPTPSRSRSTRRWPRGKPARRGSSCSTCAGTATSTCRPTSATSTARSRTTSTRSRRSRPRWRACPRSDRSPMPRLSCWSCGRQIYTVAPLEALFAEERRCPRCGAFLREERRETERRTRPSAHEPDPRPGSARRPTPARRTRALPPGTGATGRKPTRRSRPRSRRMRPRTSAGSPSAGARRRGSGTSRPSA